MIVTTYGTEPKTCGGNCTPRPANSDEAEDAIPKISAAPNAYASCSAMAATAHATSMGSHGQ
jgi:hypothetical protein